MSPKIRDVVERVVWSAVQAFAGTLLASSLFTNFGADWTDALKVAGFAALASVLKNIVAINIGSTDSPQAMPGATYGYEDPPRDV